MKSNICKIEKGTRDLAEILNESEKVAAYNGLTAKQSLQLRLICEEIDGMLPKVIDDFDGTLVIEYNDGLCEVKLSIKIPEFNSAKKDELIGIAKNKKNAAAVGIAGKIRDAVENFFLAEAQVDSFNASSGLFRPSAMYSEGVDYSYVWSLEQYKSVVNQQEQGEEWDELEKSVIASVADDVIVGVKGSRADIVIVKKFA